MSDWVGFAVSVNCGEPLGCYQGTILKTDSSTITLNKAFRNGFPYPKSQVTLNAADIKDLRIIEPKTSRSAPEQSTVALTKTGKKPARATVCENLQANNNSVNVSSTSSGSKSARGVPRSKPIDIAPPVRNKQHSTHTGSGGGGGGSTPKCRGGGVCGVGAGVGGAAVVGGTAASRRRNEACFGASASPADEDFDFEGNLALFDKRATFNELKNKPDLLKQVSFIQTEEKFRHDENVLGSGGGGGSGGGNTRGGGGEWAVSAAILAGRLRSDAGREYPAVIPSARAALYKKLLESPAADAAVVLLARAAADVAMKLAGGPRRFDARNAHQAPSVAALVCGGAVGAAGALAARLLQSAGARAAVAVLDEPRHPATLRELTTLPTQRDVEKLPPADVILLALHDPLTPLATPTPAVLRALQWAKTARALVVAIEPEATAWNEAGAARASVAALLPPRLAPTLGQLYLVDVAPPTSIFKTIDITRVPPFGASPILALHPDDE